MMLTVIQCIQLNFKVIDSVYCIPGKVAEIFHDFAGDCQYVFIQHSETAYQNRYRAETF